MERAKSLLCTRSVGKYVYSICILSMFICLYIYYMFAVDVCLSCVYVDVYISVHRTSNMIIHVKVVTVEESIYGAN